MSRSEEKFQFMKLSWEILELRTKHDFNIARAAAPPARRNVRVRIIDEDGLEGWGEAAPNAYYEESAETVSAMLELIEPRIRALRTIESADIDAIDAIARQTPHAASGGSAISAALLDLLGKKAAQPVWRMLGLPNTAPVSSFTIGIAALDVMREKVREARSYGILKIKVGTPDDEQILAMLREERPDAVIRVDANTGWTRESALRKLPMLSEYRVELLEQPLPPDDLEGLADVTRASSIPVIADESCKVAADVEKLAGCVHGVNIKLAKCGSLQEAVRIAEAARAHDLKVMIGCMIESTLGIAAAIQLAGLTDYVDLDGAALLAEDPFDGPGIESDGRVRFNHSPGLGVCDV